MYPLRVAVLSWKTALWGNMILFLKAERVFYFILFSPSSFCRRWAPKIKKLEELRHLDSTEKWWFFCGKRKTSEISTQNFILVKLVGVTSKTSGLQFKTSRRQICCLLQVGGFSGCGTVGRAVASDTRGPRFKSSHQYFYFKNHLFSVNCITRQK